jgi:riboflavin kinase/FMN adenylyltransferase
LARGRAPISSSRIRRLVLLGQVRAAAQLLGRDYFIRSTVEHGLKRGRELGFPTANLRISPNKLLPATGIYAVRVDIQDRTFAGALSVGFRPTFGGNALTVEVFVLDFDGDLYDTLLTVWFVHRLRAEKRFASVPALQQQMTRDVENARRILGIDPAAGRP